MKIAICSVQEFDPTIGGIERVSVSLANELIRQGHSVIFISCRKSPYSREYELPARQYFLPDSTDYSARNVEEMTRVLREEQVDVILNQNAHSLLYNRQCHEVKLRTGLPLVSELHFSPDSRVAANHKAWNFKHLSLKKNIEAVLRHIAICKPFYYLTMRDQRKLFRTLYAQSDRVVLLSERYIPIFKSVSGLKDVGKCSAIANMLSFPYHADETFEKEKTILFCGRLYLSQKRPDIALSVWHRIQHKLPDWKIVFVGDGPFRPQLEKMCSAFKLDRVEFVGFQNPVDYYKRASIFLMPSSHEGFPLTLSEAMQYGCVPVVFNTFASVHDQVTDGENGYLVNDMNEYDMGERVLALANDAAMREKMSRAAVASKARFTPEVIVKQWEQVFKYVTEG